MTKLQKDVAERALWTAVQAALAVVAPVAADAIEAKYAVLVPVFAAVLSAVKGFLAGKTGDPETAKFG